MMQTWNAGRIVCMVKIFQWQGNEKAAEFCAATAAAVAVCVCMLFFFQFIGIFFFSCMFDGIFSLSSFRTFDGPVPHSFKSKAFIKPMARCQPFAIHKHLLCMKPHISHVYITHTHKWKTIDREANARARESAQTESPIHISPFQLTYAGPYISMQHGKSKKHKNTTKYVYESFAGIINVVYFVLALWLETGCCDKNMNMNQTEKLIYLFSTYIFWSLVLVIRFYCPCMSLTLALSVCVCVQWKLLKSMYLQIPCQKHFCSLLRVADVFVRFSRNLD